MADDKTNAMFPGLIMPKGKPASETKPTIVPKSHGTGGMPIVAPNDPNFPGLIMPKGKSDGFAAAPSENQNSFWYDLIHPQPADLSRPQTWRDWATKYYEPSGSDFGRAALDDFTFGGADYLRSKVTGENLADLRARTADSQAALGPFGPILNAATYIAPGVGEGKVALAVPGRLLSKGAQKLAPTIGRYGAAAAESGAASGISSAVHQAGADQFDIDKVIEDTAKGVALGTAAQGFGDITSPAVQRVADYTANKGAAIRDRVTGTKTPPPRPGVNAEQWNWRQRAGIDDPTLSDSVTWAKDNLPPDHPAQPGLTNLQGALAQSTQPGLVADAASGAGGYAVNYAVGGADNPVANAVSVGLPALYSRFAVNPVAKAINTYDRNLNVGHALDQLYPALYGKTATTPVGGWADSLRDLTVGGQRPNEGDAQWW